MIVVVDYGMGNVRSVANALSAVGADARISGAACDLVDAERIVLPGVGAFAACLEPLHELGCRRNADVGRDQRFLEALPCLVVGGVEGRRGELVGERAAALAERVAQPTEETGLSLLLLGRLLVTEQPGPGRQAATASRGRRLDTICETPSVPIVTP